MFIDISAHLRAKTMFGEIVHTHIVYTDQCHSLSPRLRFFLHPWPLFSLNFMCSLFGHPLSKLSAVCLCMIQVHQLEHCNLQSPHPWRKQTFHPSIAINCYWAGLHEAFIHLPCDFGRLILCRNYACSHRAAMLMCPRALLCTANIASVMYVHYFWLVKKKKKTTFPMELFFLKTSKGIITVTQAYIFSWGRLRPEAAGVEG